MHIHAHRMVGSCPFAFPLPSSLLPPPSSPTSSALLLLLFLLLLPPFSPLTPATYLPTSLLLPPPCKTIVCIMICLPVGIQKPLRILFLGFNRVFHFYRFLIHCAYSFKEIFFHTWRILGPAKTRFADIEMRSRQ